MLTASLFRPRSTSKTWKRRIVFTEHSIFENFKDVELVKRKKETWKSRPRVQNLRIIDNKGEGEKKREKYHIIIY